MERQQCVVRNNAMLSSPDEQELRWYFCDFPNEVTALGGLRSNAGAMVDYLELGARIQTSNSGCVNMSDAIFAISARARPIERTLARMPREAVRVLKRIVTTEVDERLRGVFGVESVVMAREDIEAALAAIA